MAPVKDYDFLFKIVIVGDSGVGKSSVLLRFSEDTFTESYLTTIGVDFRFKTFNVNNKSVKLQIWDTAGQERFRTMTSAYYRGSDGIVIVYDITDRASFEHVDSWLQEVNKFAGDSAAKILVGNKSDLSAQRAVTTEEAQAKATQLGLAFIETSAQTSEKVEAAFASVAKEMIKVREMTAAATAGLRQEVPPQPRFSLRERIADTPGAQTISFWSFFSTGLVAGSISSIATKAAYQTRAMGLSEQYEFFNKPWFVSLVMFMAMSLALPFARGVTLKTVLLLALPSLFDLIGSSVQQLGLVLIPVSSFQMLKGSILIFSAVFSRLFLKRKLHLHHVTGVVICCLALVLVGAAALLAREDQIKVTSLSEHATGIGFVLVGQIVCAAQYVLEEYLLREKGVQALAMVGIEGAWGLVMMGLIVLPLLAVLPGKDYGGVAENTKDTFVMISGSGALHATLGVFFVSCFVFNVCGVMVTRHASAMHHTFLDASRTIFVWLGSLALFYCSEEPALGEPLTDWSWLQGLGFVLLVAGQCVYENVWDRGLSKEDEELNEALIEPVHHFKEI